MSSLSLDTRTFLSTVTRIETVARPSRTAQFAQPILVALAGDDCSTPTIRLAEALATERGATPMLLYVMELTPVAAMDASIGVAFLAKELLDPASRANDEASLRATCHADTGAAAAWPFEIELGSCASAISRQAQQRGAKLVVMGLHHHGTLSRALGDDTLRSVMNLGDVAVLAVHPTLTGLPRSVVVAIDFSAASVRAARLARQLVATGGTMHFVYVAPPASGGTAEHNEGRRTIERHGIEAAFAELARELDLDIRATVVSTRPDDDAVAALTTVCEAIRPELIAIGSQRRRLLEHLFQGSVSRSLASTGRWSVLVTPPGAPTS